MNQAVFSLEPTSTIVEKQNIQLDTKKEQNVIQPQASFLVENPEKNTNTTNKPIKKTENIYYFS